MTDPTKARNLSIKTEASGDGKAIKERLLKLKDDAKKKGLVKEENEPIPPAKAKLEKSKNEGGRIK